MDKKKFKRFCEWLLFSAVVATSSLYVISLVVQWHTGQLLLNSSDKGLFVLYFGMGISLSIVLYMLFQAVLAGLYKPVTKWESDEEIPGCTVIVPAYNEGSAVADTLRSLLKCNFPKEKLEIIAINDGSKDDTWNWIRLAAGESDGVIKAVNFEQNKGKKAALHYGFTHAKHGIVVTIDSDSLVSENALANLVLPFAKPEVGGVAGTVRVANVDEGFVPRMMDIWFVFSCGFMRCAQSTIGAVLCSPGAISAYRRKALLPHIDKWLDQKFLGQPSHIGEDRALTSILLRNNYHVVLQSDASVTTKVPTNYPQLCRTLLRWTRGDVREGLLMLSHFVKVFPAKSWRIGLLKYTLILQLIGLVLPLLAVPMFVVSFASSTNYNLLLAVSYTLGMTWLWALIPSLLYAEKESPVKALLAFAVGIFSIAALSWITVYSWITVRNSKWMTRDVKKEDGQACPEIRPIS